MKQRIGVIFGGFSKEREISFAGGRTVYDNLNKSIFEAVPVFVDSFGNFILLNWEYIYKGSIRDFYPPVDTLPAGNEDFQLYAESLGKLTKPEQQALTPGIGKIIAPSDLPAYFDFAFLCLHGSYGEDGRIQGLFEYLGIPYSGSGILPSAIGMDKAIQKKLMINAGFGSPPFMTIDRQAWTHSDRNALLQRAKKELGLPLVVKAAHQGSSIGISILQDDNQEHFSKAVDRSFFIHKLEAQEWNRMNKTEKTEFIRVLCDIREGIGMPLRIGQEIFYQPAALLEYIEKHIGEKKSVLLESLDGESQVLLEGFISGREFSCIVIQNEDGSAIALPPTEIKKGKELFDYRSKYLPGLSRKITPIDLPSEKITEINTLQGGNEATRAYMYAKNGLLESIMVASAESRQIKVIHNTDGTIKECDGEMPRLETDKDGNIKEPQKLIFSPFDKVTYTYDKNKRPISETTSTTSDGKNYTVAYQWKYTYDLAGRIIKINKSGGDTEEFIYDGQGNLSMRVKTYGNERYYFKFIYSK